MSHFIAAVHIHPRGSGEKSEESNSFGFDVRSRPLHCSPTILARAGRADDYLEIAVGGDVCYNPLHNDLDPYTVAYAIASLLNNLFGKSKEPFWQQAYTDLLICTCHRRGAHAIGGMAAFIPSRRDEEVNRLALQKVSEDKLRESSAGNDGTWVAHPDLVPHACKIFEQHLGDRPHQKELLRQDVNVKEKDLLDFRVPGGRITESGLRTNINIAIQYLDSWLNGNGAAAINNLMEDAATAEISRAQVWQWIHHHATLEDGQAVTVDLYRRIRSFPP